jgi:hypothetical protein
VPQSIIDDIIKVSTDAKIEPTFDRAGSYYHENGRLVAFINNATGETSIFPKLESLRPAEHIPLENIGRYLGDERIFPHDDTKILAQRGATLAGNKNVSGTITRPGNYLSDVWIQRKIIHEDGSELPICGPGTKAFFSFGADGELMALSHRWRPARKQHFDFKGVSPDYVYDSIRHQLTAANVINATVDHIDLCYYDSGNNFIQPVLRWTATVPVPVGVSPQPILGYIAAALQPPELVPNITVAANKTLTSIPPNSNSNSTDRRPLAAKRQNAINVGLYPMENDGNSQIYDDDVHNFYNALATSPFAPFIRSQDYWAKAFEYEDLKEEFVDSVNIALTRGHGSEHTFYTDDLDPGWGGVALDDIPDSGFGPGAQGSLSYWIISNCDTVTTSADYSAENFHLAYDPWWHVFNGFHVVAGFRTHKFTSDGVTLPFAEKLAIGGGFVWSWLSTVNQSPYYNPNSAYGTNPQTGEPIWYGRPSAVLVCGHTDDIVFQMEDLGRPSCLQQWWYN